MAVKPVPEGFHTVTPYLLVEGAAKLIDFMTQVLGGAEIERLNDSEGKVRHAEVRIGDSVVMIADATEKWKAMPSALYLYVPDVDQVYRAALDAGATSVMEPADQFYGDRNAGVRDASGNAWWLATHKEDVPPEEIQRRMAAAQKPSAA